MKRGFDKSEITIICGTTIGKPNMAINAELPPALLAIAESNVNNNERLIPPVTTISKNFGKLITGFPSNIENTINAIKLIANIKTKLYINFEMMISLGL